MTYTDRIVGTGYEAPDQLQANPLNWRIHPFQQQQALDDVLQTVGWVAPVIVNQRTGNLIDGHLRVLLALRNEEEKIPVLYVDLTEEEERLVLASFDPLSALGIPDAEALNNLLAELPSVTGEALQRVLDDLREQIGADAEFEPKEEKERGSKKKFDVQFIVECTAKQERAVIEVFEMLPATGVRWQKKN
mgnify:CR=1 FL=1